MQQLPDPASEEMGHLVDQWLAALRHQNTTPAQLQRYARALARASDRGWLGRTPWEQEVVKEFQTWFNMVSLLPRSQV